MMIVCPNCGNTDFGGTKYENTEEDMIHCPVPGCGTVFRRSRIFSWEPPDLCEIIALDNAADESEENLSRQCISELRRMRVRIIYDMGRDTKVMNFIKNKNIIAYMNMLETSNKSRKDFKLFCDYFEALVAFHRYYHPDEK